MRRLTGPARGARRGRAGVLRRLRSEEQGAVAVIVAIMMVVVMGMAALVVDIGGIESRKAQLQNAADAAAVAIAQSCAADAQSVAGTCGGTAQSRALSDAVTLAQGNLTQGQVTVDPVQFGNGTVTVTVASTQRDVFASVFGIHETPVTAAATASWTPAATPLPLAFDACELPAPSSSTVLLRSDVLGLFQGDCGLLDGLLNPIIPSWMVTSGCQLDINLITLITGTLSGVLPPDCASVLAGLKGHTVLLPVYEKPLGGIVLGCIVGGTLDSLLGTAIAGNSCQITHYAVFDLTGYDFQSVGLNLTLTSNNLDLLAAGVSIGTADMPDQPNCGAINLDTANDTVLGLHLNLGTPLCQGVQGVFQRLVTPAEADQLQKGDVKLIA